MYLLHMTYVKAFDAELSLPNLSQVAKMMPSNMASGSRVREFDFKGWVFSRVYRLSGSEPSLVYLGGEFPRVCVFL